MSSPNAKEHSFVDSLAAGQQAEAEVARLLGQPAPNKGAPPFHLDLGDLWVYTASGWMPGEVKADTKFSETGNAAIELMDIHPYVTNGTGVTKNLHLQVPVVYIHRLGVDGDKFLLYDPNTMLDYMAKFGDKAFTMIRYANNKNKSTGHKYRTLNGIIRPRLLIQRGAAVQVPANALAATLAAWAPTTAFPRSHDELKQIVRTTIGADTASINGAYNIKGDPAEHDAFRAQLLGPAVTDADAFLRYLLELEDASRVAGSTVSPHRA